MAGCHRNNISLLECGMHHPSLFVVFALADALGLTPVELVSLVQSKEEELGGSKPATS